eukprot:5324673-Karenia_brevis.AAC.1
MIYAKVLAKVRGELDRMKITLRVTRTPQAPPWHVNSQTHDIVHTPVVDITFVDDEAIIITAVASPTLKLHLAK